MILLVGFSPSIQYKTVFDNVYADISGYVAIPEPSSNKYSASEATVDPAQAASATLAARSAEKTEDVAIPEYAVDDLEPTYMPEEDLHPKNVHARSVDEETEPTSNEVSEAVRSSLSPVLRRLLGEVSSRSTELLSSDEVSEPGHCDASSCPVHGG